MTRYYADLVPKNIGPEEFWSRYFFRLQVLTASMTSSSGQFAVDDDDDEELVWDSVDEGRLEYCVFLYELLLNFVLILLGLVILIFHTVCLFI